MYDYAIRRVIRVVDGDTIDAEIDLGLHLSAALRFRIVGLNTPERGQPGWATATEYVRGWLDTHPRLGVETYKTDSFGRWLGNVYKLDPILGESPTLTEAVITHMQTVHGIDCRWRP